MEFEDLKMADVFFTSKSESLVAKLIAALKAQQLSLELVASWLAPFTETRDERSAG